MKSLKDVIATVDRNERIFIAAVSLTLVVLTSMPVVSAMLHARRNGLVMTGVREFSPGEAAAGISAIAQVEAGNFFTDDLFAARRTPAVLNPLWAAIGFIGRVLSLPPLAVYEATRMLFIPALAVVVYGMIAFFFEAKPTRRLAFVLYMAGAGLGALTFGGAAMDWSARTDMPIDLRIAGSNAFLSMMLGPQQIALLLFFLLSAFLLFASIESGRIRYGFFAGTAALVLFQIDPVHAMTLYAIAAAYLLSAILSRGFKRASAVSFAVFIATSFPAIAYHRLSANGGLMKKADSVPAIIVSTPALPYVLLGLGVIVPLAFVGYVIAKGGREEKWRFLAVWAAVQSLLLYAPIVLQGRLLMGMQFPLTILSVCALEAASRGIRRWPEPRRTRAALAAISGLGLVFFASTWHSIVWGVQAQKTYSRYYFMTQEERVALRWLAERPDEGAVLAMPETGNQIAAFAARRVYAGKWQEGRDLNTEALQVGRFYSGMTPDDRRRFLADNAIAYVFVGQSEGAVDLSGSPGLTPVFGSSTVQIWKFDPGK